MMQRLTVLALALGAALALAPLVGAEDAFDVLDSEGRCWSISTADPPPAAVEVQPGEPTWRRSTIAAGSLKAHARAAQPWTLKKIDTSASAAPEMGVICGDDCDYHEGCGWTYTWTECNCHDGVCDLCPYRERVCVVCCTCGSIQNCLAY